MKIKRSKGEKIFDVFNFILMTIVGLLMFYTFWNQICISLSKPELAIKGGLFLIPKGFSLSAYKAVLKFKEIWIGYKNTLFITVVGTALSVFTTSLLAYPLSRKYLPGKKFFNIFIVITMLFSGGIIPTYLVVRGMGLLDSLWSLILPTMIVGFNVIIVRNFFSNIPDSLEESAKIDGASDFTIFLKIILPLSKPVLATITLWVAVRIWNEYFHGLIYLGDRNKYTLQLVLRDIVTTSDPQDIMDADDLVAIPETLKAASIMVVTIPILVVYPFVQKYFVQGVMVGSVKG